MKLDSKLLLDFNEKNELYFKLLSNEDFDFKTKNISFNIVQDNSNKIKIDFSVSSIIDLKIALNSLVKSLEIIEKTMEVSKNDI